ncbi:hypothetical protein [Kitasatospora sp. NPDC004531]
MFRFKVAADGPDPLIVQFEPAANEMVVAPGDHITIEWPESYPGHTGVGTFAYSPGWLTILEPNFLPGQCWARVWNSAGEEITY